MWYSKTWFEYAKLNARTFSLPEYNKKKLTKLAENLYDYTVRENGVAQFIADLNSCGVGFFVLSHLQKTYLDGAAFVCNKNPFVEFAGIYLNQEVVFLLGQQFGNYLNASRLAILSEKSGVCRHYLQRLHDCKLGASTSNLGYVPRR